MNVGLSLNHRILAFALVANSPHKSRSWADMLWMWSLMAFLSASKSVIASALARSQFTEEEKLGQRRPASVIRSVDGTVFRLAGPPV